MHDDHDPGFNAARRRFGLQSITLGGSALLAGNALAAIEDCNSSAGIIVLSCHLLKLLLQRCKSLVAESVDHAPLPLPVFMATSRVPRHQATALMRRPSINASMIDAT